jgi:hypothetical protein
MSNRRFAKIVLFLSAVALILAVSAVLPSCAPSHSYVEPGTTGPVAQAAGAVQGTVIYQDDFVTVIELRHTGGLVPFCYVSESSRNYGTTAISCP